MPSQITNYQCPSCTGPLHFSGTSGRLECDYCGSSFSVEEIEALYAEKNEQAEAAAAQAEAKAEAERESQGYGDAEWDMSSMSAWGSEAAGMKAYSCPSCGAELICDATTAATSCPYCGNPTVVPSQFSGDLKPDYVIPFRLDKEAAISALKRHYQGKPLLPSSFKDRNHLEEIKGVYVPFWLFDGEAEGRVTFDATRSKMRRSGEYQVTTTEHYDVMRDGSLAFENVPVDASTKMPDDYMDSIEPFDYRDLKPFSTAYLPGFLADKYDVDPETCGQRAGERVRQSLMSAIKNSVNGYETCHQVSADVNISKGRIKYALLPVWLLNTKYDNKNYLFAMNGQTGKMVGDLPSSPKRKLAWFAGIWLPLAAILAAALLWL
ncbi:MAG: hypothetical protein IKG74_06930 [Firmicutes bacterium]|nr:hypothetical protein [Bacillota bacterium]